MRRVGEVAVAGEEARRVFEDFVRRYSPGARYRFISLEEAVERFAGPLVPRSLAKNLLVASREHVFMEGPVAEVFLADDATVYDALHAAGHLVVHTLYGIVGFEVTVLYECRSPHDEELVTMVAQLASNALNDVLVDLYVWGRTRDTGYWEWAGREASRLTRDSKIGFVAPFAQAVLEAADMVYGWRGPRMLLEAAAVWRDSPSHTTMDQLVARIVETASLLSGYRLRWLRDGDTIRVAVDTVQRCNTGIKGQPQGRLH